MQNLTTVADPASEKRQLGFSCEKRHFTVLGFERNAMEAEASSANPPSAPEPEPKPEERSLDEKSVTAEEATLPNGWEPLPIDPNYKNPDFRTYRYRESIFSDIHLTWGLMEQLEQFRGRPSDIIVASFPKSGTTWLQEIIWSITHHTELTEERGSGVTLEFRFPMLELKSQKNYMEMASLDELPDPRFIKTHLHYHMLPDSAKTSGAKVLYVSRDARDACVSDYFMSRMINIYKYRGTFAEFRDIFMRDEVAYSPYREHVKGYLEHSDTVLCLTYEQMHQDRASVVRKVADFLGVSLNDTDVDNIVINTSFEVMKANPDTNFRQWEKTGMVSGTEEGTFMRKGVVGDWKNHFTVEESDAFMKWRNEEV